MKLVGFDAYDAVDYWPDRWVQLTGKAARSEFLELRESIPMRIASLRELLTRNGLPTRMPAPELQRVNDWFLRNVSADATGVWPSLEWRSFVRDLGLALGEAAIAKSGNLRWELGASAPKMAGYRQHVLVGFGKPGSDRRRISPSAVLFTYAVRAVNISGKTIAVIEGTPMEFEIGAIETDRFVTFLEGVIELA